MWLIYLWSKLLVVGRRTKETLGGPLSITEETLWESGCISPGLQEADATTILNQVKYIKRNTCEIEW